MAADLLPFMSLVANLRCNLIPHVHNQHYFFQPYNDGKYKGYTLQCCPKGKVFMEKYCSCLPPFAGRRRRPVNTVPYSPMPYMKSKSSSNVNTLTDNAIQNQQRKVKNTISKTSKNLHQKLKPSIVPNVYNKLKKRFPPLNKKHFIQKYSINNKRRKLFLNDIKSQSKKFSKKLKFFKSKGNFKQSKKQPKTMNTFQEPFLPVSSIDSRFSLERQQLDFVRNNIEARLSDRPFFSTNNFGGHNQRTFQNTIPFGTNFNSNGGGSALDLEVSRDIAKPDAIFEVSTDNLSNQDTLIDTRTNANSQGNGDNFGTTGGVETFNDLNLNNRLVGDTFNGLGDLGIETSTENTGGIDTPMSVGDNGSPGDLFIGDNQLPSSIFGIDGSAFSENVNPGSADLGIAEQTVTQFGDESAVGIVDNSNLDGIFSAITGTGIIGNNKFGSMISDSFGSSGSAIGFDGNSGFLPLPDGNDPTVKNGNAPSTENIGFRLKEFQNMNNRENNFQSGKKDKSRSSQTSKPIKHVLFSGFGANENAFLKNNEASTALSEKGINVAGGIANLKVNPSGNMNLKNVGDSTFLPVGTTGIINNSEFRAERLSQVKKIAPNIRIITSGNNDIRGVTEKTIILSNTNEIPTAPLADTMFPDFVPPQPRIPVSLKKLKLEMDNPVVAGSLRKTKQEIKKQESQTLVFQEPLPVDICHGCKMDGGVGYTNHPTSCDRFVVCYPTYGGTMKPVTQLCPYGLFWSQSALTCKLSRDVYCPHEICKFQSDKYQYASRRTCRSFWECQAGKSVPKCCPWGYSFLDGIGCIEDPSCEIPDIACNLNPKDYIIEWGGVCDKRQIVGKRGEYERRLGTFWVKENCPPGWMYQIELCECTRISELEPPTYTFEGHTCVPEVYLPFTTDFLDYSGNNVYVRVDNASLSSGAACFDGKSALAVPAFANMDYGDTFYLHVRYKQRNPGNDLQTLVFNGDCEKRHSFMLGTKSVGNYLSLVSSLNEEKKMSVKSKKKITDWRDVWIKFERGELIIQSNDHTEMMPMKGAIARSECGMKIGWGKGFKNFVGCIDEISIHRCQPSRKKN